jgi:hypothetical protein
VEAWNESKSRDSVLLQPEVLMDGAKKLPERRRRKYLIWFTNWSAGGLAGYVHAEGSKGHFA